jgi:hypothetical protein
MIGLSRRVAHAGLRIRLREQAESGAAVHLPLKRLDAGDRAFDRSGAVREGQPGGDGGKVGAQPFGERA